MNISKDNQKNAVKLNTKRKGVLHKMGLAVSQVRLLALTRRKADIELDIQVNSKRKQALTRKSTELSQTYYQRLQQSKIQYATSDGYENVDYDYIMGKSNGVAYDDEFLQQVATMSGNVAQKTCNSMILTNNYGKVILNDELSQVVAKAQAGFGDQATEIQTAEALKAFINQNTNSEAFSKINEIIEKVDKAVRNGSGSVDSTTIIAKMLKNGGYMEGGTVYLVDGTTDMYVGNAEKAKSGVNLTEGDFIKLQDGYNYKVLNSDGSIADANTYTCMYDKASGGFVKNTASSYMQYLGNIVSYFGPMISSALKNGITSNVNITGVMNPNDNSQLTKSGEYDVTGAQTQESVAKANLADGQYCIVKDKNGTPSVWQKVNGNVSRVTNLSKIQTEVPGDSHQIYLAARNTDNLQSGLQSGMFQLCMVDNMAKGRYHKNTTLDFFIQMSYVSEKLDSSAREEITAWYNSEQSKISEQETYWDTEITNLSTELSSVNTEIDSVKTLKTNAIKSVFDWGNS